MSEVYNSGVMPILALRGITVFPSQTIHFDIGRKKSMNALDAAIKKDSSLLLVPQKNIMDDDPDLSGLYPVGTVVKVKQILRSPGENLRVLVTGIYRARIRNLTQSEPYLAGDVETVTET
jgi:ATP-dependent Lon protease